MKPHLQNRGQKLIGLQSKEKGRLCEQYPREKGYRVQSHLKDKFNLWANKIDLEIYVWKWQARDQCGSFFFLNSTLDSIGNKYFIIIKYGSFICILSISVSIDNEDVPVTENQSFFCLQYSISVSIDSEASW